MPFQGIRFPVKSCGKRIGKMTASLRASLARSRPATSLHFTFGFSMIMAPSNLLCNFFFSGSLSVSLSPLSSFLSSFCPASSPAFTGFFFPFLRYALTFSARSRYCEHFARILSFARSP